MKKLSTLVLGMTLFGASMLLPVTTQAASTASIIATQNQIAQLMTLLASLQAQLKVLLAQGGTTAPTTATTTVSTNATVDQKSVSSAGNKFTLTGTAKTPSIFVAIVPQDFAGTDWTTIYRNGSYVAFTGDTVTNVNSRGAWKVTMTGISSGTYKVLVFNNSSNKMGNSDQTLLGSSVLRVSAPSTLTFNTRSDKTLTLGVGQTATDGGITIKLDSVSYSDGLTGTATAHYTVVSKGYAPASYEGTVGHSIFGLDGNGEQSDSASATGGVYVDATAISVPMQTVTIHIAASSGKG